MRTTVRLDEHLLAEAKKQAAASGKTLTAVLEQALRARATPAVHNHSRRVNGLFIKSSFPSGADR
jgi:Arc/MetJ family transcription regulator